MTTHHAQWAWALEPDRQYCCYNPYTISSTNYCVHCRCLGDWCNFQEDAAIALGFSKYTWDWDSSCGVDYYVVTYYYSYYYYYSSFYYYSYYYSYYGYYYYYY